MSSGQVKTLAFMRRDAYLMVLAPRIPLSIVQDCSCGCLSDFNYLIDLSDDVLAFLRQAFFGCFHFLIRSKNAD